MKRTHKDRDSYHENQHIAHYNRKRSNESITPVDKKDDICNIVRRYDFIHTKYHISSNNDNVEMFQRRNEDKRYHSSCNNDKI